MGATRDFLEERKNTPLCCRHFCLTENDLARKDDNRRLTLPVVTLGLSALLHLVLLYRLAVRYSQFKRVALAKTNSRRVKSSRIPQPPHNEQRMNEQHRRTNS